MLVPMLKRYERELKIRCSHKDFDLWVQQALEADISLSDWVRRTLRAGGPVGVSAQRTETVVSPPQGQFGPNPLSQLRTANEIEGQDSVAEVTFERPATWKVLTVAGIRHSVTKKADPSAKKWAKQDLSNFCVENDVVGFQKAWDRMESEMSDGGFSR